MRLALQKICVGVCLAMCFSTLSVVAVTTPPAVQAAALSGASRFSPVAPFRVLDTRIGLGASGVVAPGGAVTLTVGGRGGVPPTNVVAVLLNVTMTGSLGPGFVQVFPTGLASVGDSSNLNIEFAGQTISNSVVVPLGVGGALSIYTQGGGHVLADVFGYFVEASSSRAGRYVSVSPTRLLDTRHQAPGKLGPGGSLQLPIAGRGGVAATEASAVVMNVTATDASANGYVQVLPSPALGFGGYSNLNVVAGQTIANLAIVPVGADGTVTVYAEQGTHVIVDVFGYFTNDSATDSADGLFVPVSPTRLLDSRQGVAPAAGSSNVVVPSGRAGVPSVGVAAVFGNVTATGATGAGYVQVLPGPASFSQTSAWSNLNIGRAGQTIPNAAIANLGSGGLVLYESVATNLLFDVSGYFLGSPLPTGAAGKACVVYLHAKGGGGQPEWTGSDGVRHSFPAGNAEGWGGLQWLYYPEPNYQAVRDTVARDIAAGGCQRVVIDGFSNGAAFAAKLYCRNETFGGTVVGYIIDDPVVDHAVEGCTPAAAHVVLYWTGDIDQPDGWPCGDWTCEGDSTIGIDRYEAALGVHRTPSIWSTHQQYVDPPEVHAWL